MCKSVSIGGKYMRCNQVTINIERFGKYVPESYPEEVQRINVYCDDFNSIYVALSKAYAMAINTLSEYECVGCRTDVSTNEFVRDNERNMYHTPIIARRYEEDPNLEYIDSATELCNDHMWIYENADKILAVLRTCTEREEFAIKLKEEFGLSDYQIKKLSQVRLDMLTENVYQKNKIENERRNAISSAASDDSKKRYRKEKRREIECGLEKLNAYFIMADNCEQILRAIIEMTKPGQFEMEMEKTYGINRRIAKVLKHFTLNDFTLEEREKKAREKKHLLEMLDFYSDEK